MTLFDLKGQILLIDRLLLKEYGEISAWVSMQFFEKKIETRFKIHWLEEITTNDIICKNLEKRLDLWISIGINENKVKKITVRDITNAIEKKKPNISIHIRDIQAGSRFMVEIIFVF